ncbi:hypothetical protein ACVWYR_004410, partial [Pantoea agglomerans]
AVVTGDHIWMLRVMERIGDVGSVRVTAVKSNPHFGAINQRRVPAIGFSGIGFGLAYPQVVIALFGVFAAEVQLHPVAARFVQMGIRRILFVALDAGGQRPGSIQKGDYDLILFRF